MDDKFFQHPGQILSEGRLGLFTQSPFLPVHFHWTTTAHVSRTDRRTTHSPPPIHRAARPFGLGSYLWSSFLLIQWNGHDNQLHS